MLKALKTKIIARLLEDPKQLRKTPGGIILTADDGIETGIRARWFQTISVGSEVQDIEENQYIFDYFCRAKVNEFNYSENMTFWSGSQYTIRHSDMQNNPQVYITEVGLYDDNGDLMAVGRLSGALEKNFSSEAIVKVRLTY